MAGSAVQNQGLWGIQTLGDVVSKFRERCPWEQLGEQI
jgi:hypothetical protein